MGGADHRRPAGRTERGGGADLCRHQRGRGVVGQPADAVEDELQGGALIGRGSGEALQVSFYGQGFVIVQPSEGIQSHDKRLGQSSQQHRHRAVVDEFDLHVGAEHAGFHVRAEASQRVGEGGDQRFGDATGRGGVPRRPSALGGVGVEGELADHQNRSADVVADFSSSRILSCQSFSASR